MCKRSPNSVTRILKQISTSVYFAILLISAVIVISVSLLKRISINLRSKTFLDVLNGGIQHLDYRSSRVSLDHLLKKKYLLLVQGRKQTLEDWVHLLTTDTYLSIMYLCFDQEIVPLRRERLRVFSKLNSTWTEGRNSLGREAFQFEREQKEEFHYWIFSDEDIKLKCSTGLCWAELFDLLDQVSNPVVAIRFTGQMEHFCQTKEDVFLTDSYDAALNCFNRKHINTLMPYVSSGDKVSWWISQAIHFRLMRVCYPLSALIPCSLDSENSEHSSYRRGRNYTLEEDLFMESYGQLENIMQGVNFPMDQYDFTNGPLTLNNVTDMKFGNKCEGLNQRFSQWLSGEVAY